MGVVIAPLSICARAVHNNSYLRVTTEDIMGQLRKVKYPGFSRDIVSFGLVKSASFENGVARVSLAISTNDPKVPKQLRDEVEKSLLALPGVASASIEVAVQAAKAPAAAAGQSGAKPGAAKGVRRAVAIASGKGGVGKSTFAVNLACVLAQVLTARGRPGRVGLMDIDIYGPSVPLMMGLKGRPEVEGEGPESCLVPMERHGVKVMSMGFLVDEDTPVVWRGPMVMKTVQQFVQNVKWGELDVLLVDLPPGTGDAQLSLVQTLPLDGAVIVTTPQPAATKVALKGGFMFKKVNVPILGVAENMSYFVGRRPASEADDLRRGRRHHHRGETRHGPPRPDAADPGDPRGRRPRDPDRRRRATAAPRRRINSGIWPRPCWPGWPNPMRRPICNIWAKSPD
jgi:ATP-binding protein involved in chromosome partitioning